MENEKIKIPQNVKTELDNLKLYIGDVRLLIGSNSPLLLFDNSEQEVLFAIEKLKEQSPILQDMSFTLKWLSNISGSIYFKKEKMNINVNFLCLIEFDHVSHFDLSFFKDINDRAQELFEEEGINGMYGIKPEGKKILPSIIERTFHSEMFGINPYPTIIDKTVKMWIEIARKQAFFNGNKRSALLSALTFLTSSGYKFNVPLEKGFNGKQNPIYKITCEVAAADKQSEEAIRIKLKKFIVDNVELNIPDMIKYTDEILKVGVGGTFDVKSQYDE